MKLQDALFNWLQIKLVSEARTEDRAARETLDFFEQILREDHHLDRFDIVEQDDTSIVIETHCGDQISRQKIDRERAEQLLDSINENPKYNSC